MKKIIVSLTLLTFCIVATANPIDVKTAARTARKILSANQVRNVDVANVEVESKVRDRISDARQTDSPAYFAFNAENNNGFVIISGDDQMPPIVGYSETGSIPSDGEMPDALAGFLNMYAEYVQAVRNGKAEAPSHAKGDITGDVVVAPLLSCEWDQDSPYNYYCPSSCPVGCVATAMAQIMYYYKYPNQPTGKISYNYGNGVLSVDYSESYYDWSILKDSYGMMEYKNASGKAVAKLSYDCGVSVYMAYSEGGSGSTIVEAYNAFFTNFGYNASAMRYFIRECTDTQEEWNRILFKELDSKRPVLYAGVSSTGGGRDSGGHAFVIDGYDSNYMVHVNWGWNGSYNGYFDVTVLDPARYTFSESQEMIVGIVPDRDGTHNQRKQFAMYMREPLSTNAEQVPVTKSFTMKPGGIFNHSPYSSGFNLAIAVYDLNGNQLKVISEKSDDYYMSLQPNYGYSQQYTPEITCNWSDITNEGTYILRLVSQESGFDDYVLPYTVGGNANNAIFVKLSGGRLYFNQIPTDIKQLTGDPDIVRTEYYSLTGQVITDTSNANGIIIEKISYSDGSMKTTKRLNK